jgi:hypothetical protein
MWWWWWWWWWADEVWWVKLLVYVNLVDREEVERIILR